MILFRVGQHIKTFSLCTKTEEVDERGRVTYTAEEPTVQIKGAVSAVSQEEKNRWKQMGHDVSHTIVIRGKTEIKPEDILLYHDSRFDVAAVENPGEVGIFQIVYCHKREGAEKHGRI